MIIVYQNRSYDTSEMKRFRTGLREIPLIFATEDGAVVFMLCRDREGKLHALKAGEREIRLAAKGFRLPELLDLVGLAQWPTVDRHVWNMN
jgi:hypothetical protein